MIDYVQANSIVKNKTIESMKYKKESLIFLIIVITSLLVYSLIYPKLFIDNGITTAKIPSTVNFGTIKSKENVNVSFTIKNTGKRNLLIKKIQRACNCGQKPLNIIIEPGKSGQINISITNPPQGIYYERIFLVCNSKQKQKSVTLTGFFN